MLRFVPQANLSTPDPIWTTAAVTITHGYCVFDTLYGVDSQMRAQPQMAEDAEEADDGRAWTIRLREGLRFHDGEPVRAQDCAAGFPSTYSEQVKKLLRASRRNGLLTAPVGPAMDRSAAIRSRILAMAQEGVAPLEVLCRDDAVLRLHLRKHVGGVWHPCGTCRFGALDDPWRFSTLQGG
jgi:hypothetical protein